ncbi:UNVERIFIED_CONTAM: hypothetical protein HDU68_004628 [Siphonaria sp. JEL0065]|nr:hypothetical protein HDU68_004628 [Siphonaria sp. JEL0065]
MLKKHVSVHLRWVVDICFLAVLTGVATVNKQPWIAGIDYSQAVDLDIQNKDTVTLCAEEVLSATAIFSNQVAFAAQIQLIALLSKVAAELGHKLKASHPSVVGMTHIFAEAVSSVPEAQPLIKALQDMTSFSVVYKVRKAISLIVELSWFIDRDFKEWFPFLDTLTAVPAENQVVLINNAQILIATTTEFKGVFFGYTFIETLQRCFDESLQELASNLVDEDIKVVERHCKTQWFNDGNVNVEYLDAQVYIGTNEFEDFVEEWTKKYTSIELGLFQSSTVGGSGSFLFYFNVKREVQEQIYVNAEALNYKVVNLVVQMPEVQEDLRF